LEGIVSNKRKRRLSWRVRMSAKTTIICTVAAMGLAVCLVIERQASLTLEQENNALRERLSQRDQLIAENQSLANLVAEANGSPSRPNGPAASLRGTEPAQELARLRREVEAFRQQSKEIEILQANTREVRAAAETAAKNLRSAANTPGATSANGYGLELLKADYWTDHTNMDVAAELRERIRGDSLKALASNSLKGDPEFGQVKHLTVVYRFGGVTMTNEFREGDFVVLPGELGR
jgi:hypothetical protein